MIELFKEDSWTIVQSTYRWAELHPDMDEGYTVYTRHLCPVRIPDQHTVTFLFGDTCKACGSKMPESIKTLVTLNNMSDTEARYFTRIQQ